MVALMFAAVLFNINVSALTSQEYEQEILGLLYDLENGYITPEQYEQYENEVTTRFIESNTDSNGVVDTVAENIANTVKSITEGIGEAVQKTGDNFKDWLSDIFDDFETQEEIPTIDLQGNGALIVATKSNGYVYKQYCEYVILEFTDNYPVGEYVPKKTTSAMVYTTDGRSWESTQSSFPIIDYKSVQVYGDVRYENGETAPSTEIPTTSDTVFNIDELSDNELDELLKDILEELERQNPDLSTIEGLLEAIYYRLGTLDSDNDNSLLGEVVSAINSLKESIENIDISFNTDKEYNFEDLFGDIKFEIDFSDFFIDFEANISLYFTVEEGYFDGKFSEIKNNFDTEFAFINNISTYVENIFKAFEALWEEEEQ